MRYIDSILRRIFSIVKLGILKVIYVSKIDFYPIQSLSWSTTFVIRNKGKIVLGRKISTRKNVEFNSNENGVIIIGNNTFFNRNCIVASHDKIEIGEDCSFGPNVVIFDHDHDFRTKFGKKAGKYKTSPIKIGNNVWCGANVIILRGVTIGDNAVIGAGTIVKEDVPANAVYHSKINNTERKIENEDSNY